MSKQDYETPRAFVAAVESVYGPMVFDLAASKDNTKVAGHFFSSADDSLAQDWRLLRGNLWLNPPFAHIAPWARKCKESHSFSDRLVFLLTPASVGCDWFEKHVHGYARVLPLLPRLIFGGMAPNPKTGKVDPYPKDLMISIYGLPPGFQPWRWNA